MKTEDEYKEARYSAFGAGVFLGGFIALLAVAFVVACLFLLPSPASAGDTVCTAVADLGATTDEKLDRLLAISREIYLSLNPLPDNGNIE